MIIGYETISLSVSALYLNMKIDNSNMFGLFSFIGLEDSIVIP